MLWELRTNVLLIVNSNRQMSIVKREAIGSPGQELVTGWATYNMENGEVIDEDGDEGIWIENVDYLINNGQ